MKTYKKVHTNKDAAKGHIKNIKERGGTATMSEKNGKYVVEYQFRNVFTYYDSEAGKQTEKFGSLEEIKKYINNFDAVGDSNGIIYKNGKPVLEYISREGKKIVWKKP